MKERSSPVSNEEYPDADQLREEIGQLQEEISRYQDELKQMERRRFGSELRRTVCVLITVAAVAVLVALLIMPVLQVYGNSMNQVLSEGDIVISVKSGSLETGDIVAFYYNNKILIKRVVAQAGEWVDISEDGTVYIDDIAIEEPYLEEKSLGDCNIELPYQVPESRVFVMGDRRSVSVDSRNTAVGCVAEEQIVGKIVFCVWPLRDFGPVE